MYQVRNYTTNQLVWHELTGVVIVQGTNWQGSCWHCHMTYVHVTNYPTTSCSLSCTILRSEVGYIFGSLYFTFHWICSYAFIFFVVRWQLHLFDCWILLSRWVWGISVYFHFSLSWCFPDNRQFVLLSTLMGYLFSNALQEHMCLQLS